MPESRPEAVPAPGLRPASAVKGLLLIVSLVALGYLFKASGLDHALDRGWIDAEVRGKGLSGELLFLGLAALGTAVGVPRQMVSFLGGYAFGVVEGALLALLGTTIGCAASLFYARLFARRWVAARLKGRVARLDRFLAANPFSTALLIRFLPVGNNLLTSLVAGVSSARAFPFIAGSAVGYLPQTAVFALAGSGVNDDPALRIAASVALFLASAALGLWLYRTQRRAHDIGDQALAADRDAPPGN